MGSNLSLRTVLAFGRFCLIYRDNRHMLNWLMAGFDDKYNRVRLRHAKKFGFWTVYTFVWNTTVGGILVTYEGAIAS